MTPAPQLDADRIAGLDTARFLGLLLMYFGHVVERVMYLQNAAAAAQYKLVYSFHMPLFFVLAGIVAKDRPQPLGAFLRARLASRVVPLLFFNLLLAALSLAHRPDFPPVPLATAADYGRAGLATVTVLTVFNVPTWFLLCLVSVEVLHFAVGRFLAGSALRIAAAAVAFYAGGWLLNARHDFFGAHQNVWMWNEAITMYAFYLVGVLVRRSGWLARPLGAPAAWLGAAAAFAVVFLTYDLNQGPFRLIQAVIILAAGHGHWLWFPLTALAGTAGVLLLARALPRWRWMEDLGRDGLLVLAWGGVVYHHVNGPAAAWFAASLPAAGWSVAAFGAIVTALSVAAGVPVVRALARWVPQLVGRPAVSGPLLPALVAAPERAGAPRAVKAGAFPGGSP